MIAPYLAPEKYLNSIDKISLQDPTDRVYLITAKLMHNPESVELRNALLLGYYQDR